MKYVVFLLVVGSVLASLAPAGAAQVHLNEILADPGFDWDGDGAVNSKLDEWVEIVNVGNSPVDLSRFRLTDESAGTDWRYELSGTLAPGEVRVFYGSTVVAWQAANGVSQFGLSLNNGGDTVYLYELVGTDWGVADSKVYAAAEVANDRALGRLPMGTGPWVVFDALNPASGGSGTGCPPTPGVPSDCTTDVEVSSWGALKWQYSK